MVREIHEALESIKEGSIGWNKSLQTLIFGAGEKFTQTLPAKKDNGPALLALTR
jgi:hypothetical protein